MSERGFTVLEVLVAAAALSVVLFGVGAFYITGVRFEHDNNAQIALQRQATVIMAELNKQIGEATISTDPSSLLTPCPSGLPDSIQVKNSRGTYCIHRDGAGSGIIEDAPGGGHRNLLSGALATLTTTTGACPAAGGFCPTLAVDKDGATVGAVVTFRLSFHFPGSDGYQAMTFTTTIAARN